MTSTEIIDVMKNAQSSFWRTGDFWIFLILSLLSLVASILAFLEARKAKVAAKAAGKTVKIQTYTIELNEIMLKLDSLTLDMKYQTARDLINETNRKVLRIMTPFNKDKDYQEIILSITNALKEAKLSLEQVKTLDNAKEVVENAVYNAVEGIISLLTGHLAELMGKFEERTLNI
jgi:hypothetical protein